MYLINDSNDSYLIAPAFSVTLFTDGFLLIHPTHFIYGNKVSDIWRRKEGNVLFNDALNTFYLRLYG